jgi:hypothetical protein
LPADQQNTHEQQNTLTPTASCQVHIPSEGESSRFSLLAELGPLG